MPHNRVLCVSTGAVFAPPISVTKLVAPTVSLQLWDTVVTTLQRRLVSKTLSSLCTLKSNMAHMPPGHTLPGKAARLPIKPCYIQLASGLQAAASQASSRVPNRLRQPHITKPCRYYKTQLCDV